MKKILLIPALTIFYLQPSFARGGGCGGHGCGHGCSHGGHGEYAGHCLHDTVNQYMDGVGLTYGGNLLIGRFMDHENNPRVFTYIPFSSQNYSQKILKKAIEKIVVAGSNTSYSYRKDSTEYCRIEQEKYLSRKLTNGRLEVYERMDLVAPKGYVDNYITIKYYGLVIHVGSIKKLDHMMRTLIPGYAEANPLNKKKLVDTVALFKAINDFNKQA
jgi:hypothetical protein